MQACCTQQGLQAGLNFSHFSQQLAGKQADGASATVGACIGKYKDRSAASTSGNGAQRYVNAISPAHVDAK